METKLKADQKKLIHLPYDADAVSPQSEQQLERASHISGKLNSFMPYAGVVVVMALFFQGLAWLVWSMSSSSYYYEEEFQPLVPWSVLIGAGIMVAATGIYTMIRHDHAENALNKVYRSVPQGRIVDMDWRVGERFFVTVEGYNSVGDIRRQERPISHGMYEHWVDDFMSEPGLYVDFRELESNATSIEAA